MDKELQELENELRTLQPVRSSAKLEARVAAALQTRRRINPTWWLALPMAAALAVLFNIYPAGRFNRALVVGESKLVASPSLATGEDEPAIFKPVAAHNILYDARDDGLVTLADGRKARQVSRSYVDTVVWRDPQSNASLTWSVPRDEVRVTPVSFQ